MTSSEKTTFVSSIRKIAKKNYLYSRSCGWDNSSVWIRTLPDECDRLNEYNEDIDKFIDEVKNLPNVDSVDYGVDRWNIFRNIRINVGSSK